jgi:hypothetical protein
MEETHTPEAAAPVAEKKSKTKLIIIGVVILVLLVVAQSFFSPEKMAERAIEDATGGAYDVDVNPDGSSSMKVTGEDGSQVEISGAGKGTLPADWPSSVPLTDDAAIDYAGTITSDGEGTSFNATFTTGMSLTEVTAFYAEAFNKDGWSVVANLNMGESVSISATQGDNNSAAAYMTTADGKTQVTLSVVMVE